MESAEGTAQQPIPALILAGGLGTRLGKITKETPKPLVNVGSKPTIAHIIDELVRNGIYDIYISVGYKAEKIIDFISSYKTPARMHFIREEEPLGTGGAIKLSLGQIKSSTGATDIFMTYGDDLFKADIRKMYSMHKASGAELTIAVKAASDKKDIESSAVVRLSENRVVGFVEKPKYEEAPSNFINIGKYIISSRIHAKLPELEKFSFERDFIEKNINNLSAYAYASDGVWYPTDTPERLERARMLWK